MGEKTKIDSPMSQNQLEALVNTIADAVVAVDSSAKIVMCNAAALDLLDQNAIVGKTLNAVAHLTDPNNQPVNFNQYVQDIVRPAVTRELRIRCADSTKINIYLSVAPVKASYGQDQKGGYVLVLRDITREKSLEDERNEFISVVSHELRTPIAIAEGNVSNAQFIAEKRFADASVSEMLKQAHDQILFLGTMINDLSTLSRAEQGSLSIEVGTINIHKMLTTIQSEYSASATEKNLNLLLDLHNDLHALHSSELYVREILQNFITNAIKYTDTGSVTVRAYQKAQSTYIEVEDTGIGISKQDQERVFDKFFRSENYKTREHSGNGLGLYITMKLAHLLHAKITLQSHIDKGSVFIIEFPDLA